jgi:peptide/nickel transport system substrate-binding protein
MQGAVAAGTLAALGATPALAQTPVTGTEIDELKFGVLQIAAQLDPQKGGGVVANRLYPLAFDTLIKQDWKQNGMLVPNLATAWTQVDDLTIDFTIRQGVTFTDGSPLTADDVVFTFERVMSGDPTLGVTGVFPLESVTAVDDFTVRFVTTSPSGIFLYLLASHEGANIVPRAYFNQVGADGFQFSPVGTGPFRVSEYEPDSHITFERNESYFGGVSPAKRVIVSQIPEVSTRIAALLNGEQDIILDLPADQLSGIEDAGGFTIDSSSPWNVQMAVIYGGNAPMDKKEVRQAMNLSLDRQTIVDELLGGHGKWPSGIQGTTDPLYVERPQLPYDPDAAKALLEQAGYAGEEIQFTYMTPDYYPLEGLWAQAAIAMWQAIGLNVVGVPVDIAARRGFDGTESYHLCTNSAIEVCDRQMVNEGALDKFFPAGALDEQTALIARAISTVDPTERGAVWQEFLDWWDDFAPQIVLFTVNRIAAMRENVSWRQFPNTLIDLTPNNLAIS